MGQDQSERVSVNRHEFEAFVSENQDLVERYGKLLDKVRELTQRSKELEERLRVLEQETSAATEEGDRFFAEATARMRRLMQEADRRPPE
jgi:cell division septum initiation protein DivIVA